MSRIYNKYMISTAFHGEYIQEQVNIDQSARRLLTQSNKHQENCECAYVRQQGILRNQDDHRLEYDRGMWSGVKK